MGPRPRGRGIQNKTEKPLVVTTASMGPRPRGRGISLLVTSCQTGAQHLYCERLLLLDESVNFRLVHHSLGLLVTGLNGVRAGPGFEAPPCRSRIQLSKNMEKSQTT